MSNLQNNNPNPKKKPATKLASLAPRPKPVPGRKDLDRLPADMMITIDGQARTGKNTAGELLAVTLGGVLVDSGRFYRSLTQAVLMAGVELDDSAAVESFCTGARLDALVRPNKKGVFEALVTVNSGLFTDATLVSVGPLVPAVARVPLVRAMVNATLRRLYRGGRMIILGRDIGMKVFPNTPYQFVLTAPPSIREARDSGNFLGQAVMQRDQADARQTWMPPKAAIVDTGDKSPEQVLAALLDEIVARTPD